MQTFNKNHFEEILGPCQLERHESGKNNGEPKQQLMDEQYFCVNDAGVFPGTKYDAEWQTCETLFLRWRPARSLEDPTIDVAETPILSFDFTARQLAAFMLSGPGSLVADFYGDWGDGPDPASLRKIDPDSKAHTAVLQAYAAYRDAERIVGAYPLALDNEADRVRKEYNEANLQANKCEKVFDISLSNKPGSDESKIRRARALASTVGLGLAMEAKAFEADVAQKTWLKAMVRQLMQSVPAKATATPAPVVVASDASAKPAAMVDRGLTLKKAALIDKYEHQWRTINRDFQDASENELSKAAKAPRHGNWFEEDALNWARQRGKLSEATGQQAPSPATVFSGLTHRIQG